MLSRTSGAIKIQSIYRMFHCKKYYQITQYWPTAVSLFDEVILGLALESVAQLLHDMEVMDLSNGGYMYVVGRVCATLEKEAIEGMTRDVVVDLIREVTDKFLQEKRQEHKTNPIVSVITTIIDDGLAATIRTIAVESINESVKEYLATKNCVVGFDALVLEEIHECSRSLVEECMNEILEESLVNGIVGEVVSDEVEYMSEHLFDDWRAHVLEEQQIEDMAAYTKCIQDVIAKRFVLGHCLMSMENCFHSVVMEYYVRIVVEKMAAARLLKTLDAIERRTQDIAEDPWIANLLYDHSRPLIEDGLVGATRRWSDSMLAAIDAVEIDRGST